MGIPQARMLEWVAISFPRGCSWPRDWTRVPRTVGRRFTWEMLTVVPAFSLISKNQSTAFLKIFHCEIHITVLTMVKFSSIKSIHIVVYHLHTGHFLSYETETLNLLRNHPLDPFPPSSWQQPSTLTAWGISCKWDHTGLVILWLAYFTERNTLKVHPSGSMCHNFFLFKAAYYWFLRGKR